MKTLSIFLLFIVLILGFPMEEASSQKSSSDAVTTEEVKKLIDEKIGTEKTLTQEELTNALLEMKNEKIENLEGNLAKVIDTAALYVAGISVVLAIIGWLFKKSIDDKLTKIEEKEINIKNIEQQINHKFDEIKGYHSDLKEFSNGVDSTKEQLKSTQGLFVETEKDLVELKKYIATIEDIINSGVLVAKFLDSRVKIDTMIGDIKQLFNENFEYTQEEILKLSEKLSMCSEIDSIEKLRQHFDYCVLHLKKEEEKILEKYSIGDFVLNEYYERDSSTMTLYEEIFENYDNWECYSNDIVEIQEFLIQKHV